MKSKLVLIGLGLGLGLGLGACDLFGTPSAPTSEEYGRELFACEMAANTAEEYTACCIKTASKYGRDPRFCDLGLDADAGAK